MRAKDDVLAQRSVITEFPWNEIGPRAIHRRMLSPKSWEWVFTYVVFQTLHLLRSALDGPILAGWLLANAIPRRSWCFDFGIFRRSTSSNLSMPDPEPSRSRNLLLSL